MKYDYLVVGAGLFGSVFACEMNRHGRRVLVIDQREIGRASCRERVYVSV